MKLFRAQPTDVVLQRAQVPLHHRHHIGIDDRGASALVFAILGRYTVRETNVSTRAAGGFEVICDEQFVHWVCIREKQAYGDSFDTCLTNRFGYRSKG
jgi:hypothetical protein